MLRFILILLLVLNALLFAAISGWLGESTPKGEPERLDNQLNADRIALVTPPQGNTTLPPPASSQPEPEAPPPPPQPERQECAAWEKLNTEQANRLSARLHVVNLTPQRSAVDVISNWWVHIPSQPTRPDAERVVRELKTLGIADAFIINDSGPTQFAISLGLFSTEVGAQTFLQQIREKGVGTAVISPRTASQHRFEVTGPANVIKSLREANPGNLTTCKS